jgi:N-methylhydantoinase A
MTRVGIDIGGTFTDLVAETKDGIVVVKVPSTPSDPSQAFDRALGRVEAADEVLHGTTVGTNAVLTRSGARIAFITTEGFRHLLHLARQNRPSLYDLQARPPAPLVERDMCVGVPERVDKDGLLLHELDEDATRAALSLLDKVDGVAVTLLHSYANPKNEHRVAELIKEILGDVPVSLSSDVLPEFREYERASTTALNAYVQPVLSNYLGRIDEKSGDSRVGVMWSGGGIRAISRTIEQPVHTLMSGPAAGVLGAAWVAERCDEPNVVTLDMGGTSADVALIDNGRPLLAEESKLDGLPFRTPCLDVISVGAGGGSIAWVDEGGALRVGPASAGAEPGPVCYGRGGTDATVTDAQAVLGYLGDEGLAGGELRLDQEAALAALDRLGEKTGLSRIDAARGVLRVVRATMARAIRTVSIERGKDVRRYALVVFGGAGPLHGCELASELGIERVIVPPAPGALAALGLLVSARRADASVSRPMTAERTRDGELRTILHELTEQVLAELEPEGVAFAEAEISLAVDCRYRGQSHELRVEIEKAPSFVRISDEFHRAHADRYGFSQEDVSVDAITFRATAHGPHGDLHVADTTAGSAEPIGRREIEGNGSPVYDRHTLGVGTIINGPAIVVELDSTTWIAPGWQGEVRPGGALVLTKT